MKIKCYTIFDITRTNVSNRRRWLDDSVNDNLKLLRNQQTNFETILQIINMRSQPEDITDPVMDRINLAVDNRWGKNYTCSDRIPVWTFSFTVNHTNVFTDENHSLGKLIQDCSGVPMITELREWPGVTKTLAIDDDYRNIFFEILQ